VNKVYLAETLAVCGVAAIATAWLGTASGLFVLVRLFGFFALAMPYLALALLAWSQRRLAITPIILLALSILVAALGLFFLFNDWYWPRPTNPNPRRDLILLVIAVPQWLAVGVAALTLLACHLCRRWYRSSSNKVDSLRLNEL
jgi:hypothetical protein